MTNGLRDFFDAPDFLRFSNELRAIIGKKISSEIAEDEIRKVALKDGFNDVRVVGPQDAFTLDFNPDRLNVIIDEYNKISDIKSG